VAFAVLEEAFTRTPPVGEKVLVRPSAGGLFDAFIDSLDACKSV
jgi:hypothetical protein